MPAAGVRVAQPELAPTAAAGLDRALDRLLQPTPQRRHRRRPSLDIAGTPVLDPMLMVRSTFAEQHRKPFAGRNQALRTTDHRVGGVDQDHRDGELGAQPRRQQCGQILGAGRGNLARTGHANASDPASTPAATRARRASSTSR